MNNKPVNQGQEMKRQLSGLALLPLIFLPCLLAILSIKIFDGPGMGDKYGQIGLFVFNVVNAICSLGTAIGFARLFSLTGFARIAILVVFGIVLYYLSEKGTHIAVLLVFLPRH